MTTAAESDALAVAVTALVVAGLRWQLTVQGGHHVSGSHSGPAAAAHQLTLAAGELGRLLDPVRPERFVAKLMRARAAVLDELDPLRLSTWARLEVD